MKIDLPYSIGEKIWFLQYQASKDKFVVHDGTVGGYTIFAKEGAPYGVNVYIKRQRKSWDKPITTFRKLAHVFARREDARIYCRAIPKGKTQEEVADLWK